MRKSHHTFKGGYSFRRFENSPRDVLIEQGIPERVIIPLAQGFGSEVKPLINVGSSVTAGQIIARDDENISSPIHASVSGVVEEIKRIRLFLKTPPLEVSEGSILEDKKDRGGLSLWMNYSGRDTQMVVIRADRPQKNYARLDGYNPDWTKLNTEEIEKLLYLSGVTSLDREGIPTRFRSSIIGTDDVENIIVHGVGSEPYNISLDVILFEKKLLHLAEGLRILNKVMPKAKIHLALDSRNKQLLGQMKRIAAEYEWLDVYSLESKYPQGYDEMLVKTILNRKFPFGYSAANIGIVVLNIQAVVSIYDAVAEGKPLIERVIALCGPGFKESLHMKVRVGTPLADIVSTRLKQGIRSRIVLNSLLTGVELNDLTLPVGRAFSQIIALPESDRREFLSFTRLGIRRDSYSRTFASSLVPFLDKILDTNIHGEERACISCNYCEEVCPVQIIPHLLAKYVKNNIIDESLSNFEIFNCIECGLCSYVCPSKIPLLEFIKQGQEKSTLEGHERDKSILPQFKLKGLKEYKQIISKK